MLLSRLVGRLGNSDSIDVVNGFMLVILGLLDGLLIRWGLMIMMCIFFDGFVGRIEADLIEIYFFEDVSESDRIAIVVRFFLFKAFFLISNLFTTIQG